MKRLVKKEGGKPDLQQRINWKCHCVRKEKEQNLFNISGPVK